jgi:AcrR family transcriptional regulator
MSDTRRRYGGRSAAERQAERRERLMSSGLEMFGAEGYAAVSIERLCSTANVSTRNFYEEFAGREALLVALHDQVNGAAAQIVAAALEEEADADLATRVRSAVRAYIATTSADPRWARIAYVEVVGVSPAVERHRLGWRDRWVELLTLECARAVQRGEVAERDFRMTLVAFIGAVNALVSDWSTQDRGVPLDDVAAELARLAIAAITS